GLIALLLLWLAIRSAKHWYRWYFRGKRSRISDQSHDQNPD
ncbi:MAG: DUF4126 domain-containing protein, partial [Moorea sp. SIO3I7]|nr:DUF4126 domain-containing protein [Moorena sp. SIO3I7]NEO01544.1 DUF4126 domain-containing protein [Moorena sp. SIO3I7]